MRNGIDRREVLKATAGIGALGLAGGNGTASVGEGRSDGPDRHIVGVTPTADTAAVSLDAAREYAAAVHREVDLGEVRHLIAGEYAESDIDELRSMDAVAYVERDGVYHPHRPVADAASNENADYPWGVERIGALAVHEEGYTGSGTDIVVIDTGTDPVHDSLEANVEGGTAFGDSDCTEADRGYEGVECNAAWDDDDRHGTHVAGTAAAVDRPVDEGDNPDVSIDRIAGVAPEATVQVANVFEWQLRDGTWVPRAPWSNTAAAIQWAADENYDVANASLGGESESNAIRDALEYATVVNNLVFVASAGNRGGNDCDEDCVTYPAAFDEAVAVAATTPNDSTPTFSSKGPEVEVAAPGVSIPSSVPAHVQENSDWINGDHATLSGTSMAAPHVTGLAALVTAHTNLEDNAAIRQRIRDTAQDIGLADHEVGHGLVSAADALGIEPPSVSTEPATDVGTTETTLNGTVETLGDAGTVDVRFEYAAVDGGRTFTATAGSRSEPGEFDATVSDLEPDTEYEFSAVVEGAARTTARGDSRSVTTVSLACPYTNETGIVDTAGLREAVADWRSGAIGTDVLAATVDAWGRGQPITSCR